MVKSPFLYYYFYNVSNNNYINSFITKKYIVGIKEMYSCLPIYFFMIEPLI